MKFKDFFSKTKLKDWFVTHAETRRAKVVLGAVAFTESIFFPIPPDFFLMAILAANNGRRWAYYSLLTSVFSVLGGITSYAIGYLFFDALGAKIIDFYNLQEDFQRISVLFHDNAFISIFISTFTPLPDKVFNLVAGLFKIKLVTFVAAYILGRALRFFFVGYMMKLFGARAARMIYRNLGVFTIALALVIVIIIFLVTRL